MVSAIGVDASSLRVTGVGKVFFAADGSEVVALRGASLDVAAGVARLDTDAGGNLLINVDTGASTHFDATQHLAALDVASGASASLSSNGSRLLRTRSLDIAAGGTLNLNDNDLIVDYTGTSPYAAIKNHVVTGRNTGTSGIITTATALNDTVLAVVDNAQFGRTSFNGIPIDATTIIGKYTFFGDGNLDGKVTGDDYVTVDANLGRTNAQWIHGDFNFSGTVTGDDYVAIDANLGKGTPNALAYVELKEEMVAAHVAMFGEEYLVKLAAAEADGFGASVVPEPAAISLVGLGALGLLGRRRRTNPS